MVKKLERGLNELYQDDAERADAVVFGRRTDVSRRGFFRDAGLVTMGAAVGASMPFAASFPAGMIPAALAQDKPADAKAPDAKPAADAKAAEPPKGPQPLDFPGKDPNLVVLGDKPLVAEAPEWLLDDETTPVEKFYIRNNGQVPEAAATPDSWAIKIDGEVEKPLELTLGDLKSKFKAYEYRMVLECGGNGRSFFAPQAKGNQWTNGGAGCAVWKGARLADVLKAAGLKSSAVYTAHYGADVHLSGDATKDALSRGVRLEKAMDEHTLIVWDMNGAALPNIHGGPVRLIVPGWTGSASHKWLKRIWIRDKEHDGQGMKGTSYRLPATPMVPGAKADESTFKILEAMPIRTVISSPKNGAKLAAGTRSVELRGATWASENDVATVELSVDFGVTWTKAKLGKAKNTFDWTRWTASVALPSDGYFEVWARGTDSKGVTQPFIAGNWNPSGYGANPYARMALLVG